MTPELLHVAHAVLEQGHGLPGEVEVYVQHSQTTSIKVYGSEVESLVTGEPRGVGVRYVEAGRVGYAYAGDLSMESGAEVVRRAAENAAATEPDAYAALPEAPRVPYEEVPGLWRPALVETAVETKIDCALEAEAAALACPEIETVEESAYVDSASRVALVSSRGVEAYGEQTFCYVYVSAHARRQEDVQTGLGYQTGREPADLDPRKAGRQSALQAAGLLGAKPCPTGRYTVVLDREVTASVLGVVSQALTAEAVQKGRSLFAGKVGQQVASERFTLVDDGLHMEGMATSPFDDEGVPRVRVPLIEAGGLTGFLHDTHSAAREGGESRSTGSAARGSYRSAPRVAPSNLVLLPGSGTLEELLARVDTGLYVVSITGLHSGANPVSGEFSVGARGHLIRGGTLGPPVREVTIASDLLSMLGNVVDAAADSRWIPFGGSVLAPAVAVADVAVSGT
jgi:PmbA protein